MNFRQSSSAMEAAEPPSSSSVAAAAGGAAHFRHRHPSFALKYPYLNPLPAPNFRRPSPPRKRSAADRRRPSPHDGELRFPKKMPMLFENPNSSSSSFSMPTSSSFAAAGSYPYPAHPAFSRSRLDSAAPVRNPNLASALRPASSAVSLNHHHHLERRPPFNFVAAAAAPVNPNPNSAPLSCPLCQKAFQSVRALGGHMRIHGGLHGSAAAADELHRQQHNPDDPNEPTAAAAARKASPVDSRSEQRTTDPAAFPAFPARSSEPSTAAAAQASSPSGFAEEDEADPATKTENQAIRSTGAWAARAEISIIDSANAKYDGESMATELFCDEQLETESPFRDHNYRPQRRLGYVSTAALRNLRDDDDDDEKNDQRCSVVIAQNHRQAGTPSSTYGKSDGDIDLSPETQSSCRTCGKTFFSQKALHGHMRCHRSTKRKTTTTELLYRRINEEEEVEEEEEQGGHDGTMDIDDDKETPEEEEETRSSEHLHVGRIIGGGAPTEVASFWPHKSRRAPASRHSHNNNNKHISKLWKAIAAAINPPLPPAVTIDEKDDGTAKQSEAAPEMMMMDASDLQPEHTGTIGLSAGEERSEESEMEQEDLKTSQVDTYYNLYTDDELAVAEALLMLYCSSVVDHVHDNDPSMSTAPPPLEEATEKAAADSRAFAVDGAGSHHNNNNNRHECSVCLRVFPTGQALGGHKRCHWNGPGAPGEKGEEAGMEEREMLKKTKKKKKIWLIDLNLPAPTESEDEVVVSVAAAGVSANIEAVPA